MRWPILFLLLALTACRGSDQETPEAEDGAEGKPNILLVTYCTMRADRWGVYGGGDLTPRIDAVAREGIVFRNHYTQASYSGGSFASIITGKYPFHHGIYDHPRRLADEHVTLAELFQQDGYATGAFLTHNYLAPRWNYPQGIDRYNEFDFDEIGNSKIPRKDRTYRRVREALQWVDEIGDRPYFLWFQSQLTHYFPQTARRFVAAVPFRTAQQFRQRTGEIPNGRIQFAFDSLGEQPQVRQALFSLYDGAVAQTDEILGLLLDGLKERGRLGNTVIVLTADHGEVLGEHELMFNHDSNVLEPTVHVPLILRVPGRQPMEIASTTRNIDLLPTLSALAGVVAPTDIDGRSLLPLLAGADEDRPVFAESRPQARGREKYPLYPIRIPGVAGKVRTIRRGEFKLIHAPTSNSYRAELYDLGSDPTETTNLAEDLPEVAQRLGRELEQWFSAYANADTGSLELDDEDLESLRALGYLD